MVPERVWCGWWVAVVVVGEVLVVGVAAKGSSKVLRSAVAEVSSRY